MTAPTRRSTKTPPRCDRCGEDGFAISTPGAFHSVEELEEKVSPGSPETATDAGLDAGPPAAEKMLTPSLETAADAAVADKMLPASPETAADNDLSGLVGADGEVGTGKSELRTIRRNECPRLRTIQRTASRNSTFAIDHIGSVLQKNECLVDHSVVT